MGAMRLVVWSVVALIGFELGLAREGVAGEGATRARPNVVVILADDLGANGLGCTGSDLHETPNLDRLAAQGMRFTRAFAMPVCSPTRASLMTGQHAARLHITTWREAALSLRSPDFPSDRRLIPPAPEADLPLSVTTLAEMMREEGYRTFHVGKWHLGDARGFPEVHGFDVNVGGNHWGAPATYFHPFRTLNPGSAEIRYVPGLGVGKEGDYLTDRLTDEALKSIDEAGDQRFFLNLWHHAPHTPIQARPELIARFEAKRKPGQAHFNPAYAAMIASLDESVGRVLAKLDERGLTENTIVVFLSDNGGQVATADGVPITSNAPLRSGKGSVYEGGIRVPMIVRWPGVVPAGSITEEPALCTDLFPTIAEVLGRVREARNRDGASLLGVWKDPKARLDREALYFHYPHDYPRSGPASAIRTREWKLIQFLQEDRVELYDLANDPSETKDVADSEPDRAKELVGKLEGWKREVGAQPLRPNPAYRP